MHDVSTSDVLARLATDATTGLTQSEADHRLHRHGPNVLPRVERRGPLLRLARQFHDPLIYTLLVAAAVTYAVGGTVDASVILGVVLANAAIGSLQESRAERALDSLAAMVTVEARVVRDGAVRLVPASDLVAGDLTLLEAGDKVAADLRLLDVDRLQIDESALTGESVAVTKSDALLAPETPLGDRVNSAFSGTLVTAGRATGAVVATGADTEIGRIHRLLGDARSLATPLTRKLAGFSRQLTVAIVALAAVTFAVGLARGESGPDMLVAAVALAVGAIPEGLPAAVTIALAIGVSRMARRKAIVRRLPAVETLGSTTVICTDKTGTLTQNEMTVQAAFAGGRRYEIRGVGYSPDGEMTTGGEIVEAACHPALQACLMAGLLCGDGDAVARDDGWTAVGDPTEAALVVAARKAGLERATELEAQPRTDVIPFDSERRFMATVHGGSAVYVKGAVERVLAMCDRELAADGRDAALGEAATLAEAQRMGASGMRVLAFAQGTSDGSGIERLSGLTFVGLQGMVDPPRAEAVAAVRACQEAGIAVKMITGDHAATAGAIAERVGLSADRVVTGSELATTPDADLAGLAVAVSVFARVTAEQKLRLVRALQHQGHVVAMTGDGVNDAPALKRADIGVAMGESGTEVARESADIVLADDNFASIAAAVEEGRHTFDNLKKFIVWTLPTNLGLGLLIVSAIAVGVTLPVLPVQVLWVNMTTAVLLGLTLAFERTEPAVMRRSPRPPSAPLLTRALAGRIVLVSLLLLVASFWLFADERAQGAGAAEARTVAVNVFVAVQILYLFSCRSLRGRVRELGLLSNRWLVAGVVLTAALQALFTYWTPMNELFHTAPVSSAAWIRIGAIAAIAWAVVELEKAIARRRRPDTGLRQNPDSARPAPRMPAPRLGLSVAEERSGAADATREPIPQRSHT